MLWSLACDSGGDGGPAPDATPAREVPPGQTLQVDPPLQPDAGFVALQSVEYELDEPRTMTGTNMFYSLLPADDPADDSPIFVFFNGGPGGSTALLRAFGTGPHTLDVTDPEGGLVPNPSSFTQLGHILYIDSRQAGFSYSPASEAGSWEDEYDADNFNVCIDAADFVRTLLEVLAQHPRLTDNPVVLVGESYGGTRAQVMLAALLYPEEFRPGGATGCVDPTLADAVDAHHEAIDVAPEPTARAAQFGAQVLIQPLIAGYAQYEGAQVNPAPGYSAYHIDTTEEEMAIIDASIEATVTTPESAELLFGMNLSAIEGLTPPSREPGLRFDPNGFDPAAQGCDSPLTEAFGSLEPGDCYHVAFNSQATVAFPMLYMQGTGTAGLFLRNLVHVRTLITDAAKDAAIVSPRIMPALQQLPDAEVSYAVGHDGAMSVVDISYRVDPDGPVLDRRFAMPHYAEAGHSVTMWQPEAFFQDVATFLAQGP